MWKFSALVIFVCAYSTSAQFGSRCTTPNKEAARCISIYNCPILYNSVTTTNPQIVNFLRQSQCGFDDGPLVCCGTSADYVGTNNGGPSPLITPKNDVTGKQNLLPTNKVCGFHFEDKILNGETAGLEEFPWMALLKYRNGSGHETFSCGGTLISNRYVLTAAHCITGKITKAVGKLVSVRLGEWNTETAEDCPTAGKFKNCADPPVNVAVEEAIAHAQYDDNARDRQHDIGLVRLQRSVQFTNYIRPACLPSSSDGAASVGEKLTVVGWGRTETGKYSATKQKLLVPINDANQCRATFRRSSVNIRETQICAGGERDKDSCNGDSGGPLLRSKGNDHQFFLEGVVSFGAKCGTEGWPGIYTRVTSYKDWILSNIRA